MQLLFQNLSKKNPKQSLLLNLFSKNVVSAIFVTASFRALLQQVPKNQKNRYIERVKISCSESQHIWYLLFMQSDLKKKTFNNFF